MNNVESAAAAGDNYSLRDILLADGFGAVIGSLFGSPFPPAVYIGHPGWKSMGGRIGYSLATGVCVGLVCFLGLVSLLLAVIPLQAVLPILLYIGIVITAQAFEATPIRHAPAIVLALVPNLAEWAKTLIDSTLSAAGATLRAAGQPNAVVDLLSMEANRPALIAQLGGAGVVYHGMELLGGGAILAGMVLGAIAAFVIDREFRSAVIYCAAGAVLSAIGFIHGSRLEVTTSTLVMALGYIVLGAVIWVLTRGEAVAPATEEELPAVAAEA
jgi:AGZA family xanthine/uracil permease-like MFS transporter